MTNVVPIAQDSLFPELTDTPTTPGQAARPAPKRLYESPLVTVWHGKAEDVVAAMPTESVDLIVTDPPYGVEWQSNRRKEKFERLANDTPADRDGIRAVLGECVRVVRQHRHLYVFGPTDVLEGLKVSEAVSLVWDKGTMGSGDVTAAWGPQHEPISFVVSKHRHAGKAGKSTIPTRMRKGSILSYTRPTGRNVKRHPDEKPVPLMRELIESSSRQGETVLDCYAGSGPVGVAAILSGRRAILVDEHLPHAETCVERAKAAEQVMAQANGI